MQQYIDEILETNNKYQFIAGIKYRALPINHDIQNHGVIYPEKERVLRLVSHTSDINTLTKRTKNNILQLSELYNIKWIYILKYIVQKKHPGSIQRHSLIIYGMWNNNPVTFFRKETTNPIAGSTNLYFGYGNRIQVVRLFNPQESFKYKNKQLNHKQDHVFIKQFKKLYKCIKSDELERIILMNH